MAGLAPGARILRLDRASARSAGAASHDAVLMDCALSSSRDPGEVLRWAKARLLPAGRIILADIAVEAPLPDDVLDLLGQADLLGQPRAMDGYAALLAQEGFAAAETRPLPQALPDLLAGFKGKLAAAEIGVALGLAPITPRLYGRLKELLALAQHLAEQGRLCYFVIVATSRDVSS